MTYKYYTLMVGLLFFTQLYAVERRAGPDWQMEEEEQKRLHEETGLFEQIQNQLESMRISAPTKEQWLEIQEGQDALRGIKEKEKNLGYLIGANSRPGNSIADSWNYFFDKKPVFFNSLPQDLRSLLKKLKGGIHDGRSTHYHKDRFVNFARAAFNGVYGKTVRDFLCKAHEKLFITINIMSRNTMKKYKNLEEARFLLSFAVIIHEKCCEGKNGDEDCVRVDEKKVLMEKVLKLFFAKVGKEIAIGSLKEDGYVMNQEEVREEKEHLLMMANTDLQTKNMLVEFEEKEKEKAYKKIVKK